jgi:thiol-disulfide isomerase/thioredoxin
LALLFALAFALLSPVPSRAQQRRQRPPEMAEVQKAMQIQDLPARLQELERIRRAYPSSQYAATIESAIQFTKIQMAGSVDEVVSLQAPVIQSADGMNRVFVYYTFSWDILRHPNIVKFDKRRVTAAIEAYAEAGMKLAQDPQFQKTLPAEQVPFLKVNWPNLFLTEAAAYLNAGETSKAVTALQKFTQNGGVNEQVYAYLRAEADAQMGRKAEALEGYLKAAAENYGDAMEKARILYQQLNGNLNGFEARVEAKQRALPFKVEPFKPAAKWSGKTVLVELFTGSECPPCAASDLALDGVIEAYDTRYVAVLEYHLPIPRPDPMMNKATADRRQFYGISSTPTIIYDGQTRDGAGGYKAMAQEKFKAASAEIESRLAETPAIRLALRAAREGDQVTVSFTPDRMAPGADCYLALVQIEEQYKGSNGILFHKMVVRDLVPLNEEALKSRTFGVSIGGAESSAALRLAEFERSNGFTFPVKKYAIDRSRLRVVLFVQDRATKKVLNAAVADVK